jgi:hypothetical protein
MAFGPGVVLLDGTRATAWRTASTPPRVDADRATDEAPSLVGQTNADSEYAVGEGFGFELGLTIGWDDGKMPTDVGDIEGIEPPLFPPLLLLPPPPQAARIEAETPIATRARNGKRRADTKNLFASERAPVA